MSDATTGQPVGSRRFARLLDRRPEQVVTEGHHGVGASAPSDNRPDDGDSAGDGVQGSRGPNGGGGRTDDAAGRVVAAAGAAPAPPPLRLRRRLRRRRGLRC